MSPEVDTLIDELRDIVGDGLRVVATYEAEEYEIHYVRDDLRDDVGSLDVDRIHRELIMEGISREYLEELFDAGDLGYLALSFEQALALHFAGPGHTGLYVAIEPDAVDPLPALHGCCESFVS